MEFNFKQGRNFIDLGNSFDILKGLREDFKDKSYDEKPEISRLYNKFSGNYFSPTFVKSFMACPMKCFLTYFDPRTSVPITNLGSATHKVYERIIKDKILDKKEQEIIANEEYKNFQLLKEQKSTFTKYINNFIKFDNCNGKKLFDDGFEYFPEYFIREDNLNVFDCNLGSCYMLIDRLDINVQDKIINIIDYKTGKVSSIDNIINSYTDQMITYYWGAKANFEGFDINCYLYLPDNNTYLKIDVQDIESQSRFVDKVFDFYDSIKDQRDKNIFHATKNENCKYCNYRNICNAYNGKIVSKEIVKEVDNIGVVTEDRRLEET